MPQLCPKSRAQRASPDSIVSISIQTIRSNQVSSSDAHLDRVARLIGDVEGTVKCSVETADSPSVIRSVDIVCTATTASTPVFLDPDLQPETHINAIGAYRPDMSEIPPATLRRLRVVIDQRPSALEEAGEIVQGVKGGILEPESLTELGELVAGTTAGRSRHDESTLFKSVGKAEQYLFAARDVFRKAEER
jgi:ornithine cyclodeaminase/alanine dehydrogenase-like protein (mu-crystallin family)